MNILDQSIKFGTYIVGMSTVSVMVLTAVIIINPHLADPKYITTSTVNAGEVAGASTKLPTPTFIPTSTPTPTPIPVADPALLKIPTLGIEAMIENVGVTADNTMEVPQNPAAVGWYQQGIKPGAFGNTAAILNGHFDTVTGQPAVFYNLDKIIAGDEITVVAADGFEYTYVVENIESYPLENFPTDIVYGSVDGSVLKLITCDGIWDPLKGIYSKRLVVTGRMRS